MTASAIAVRENVCPARALIANGLASERLVYAVLARHLGVPYIEDWPEIDPVADPAAALAADRIFLRCNLRQRRLLAPEGEALRDLLRGSARYERSCLAITTPAHLAALVHYRAQPQIAYLASGALPTSAPHLSARGVCGPMRLCIVPVVLAIIGFACVLPRAAGDLFGVLFLAGMVFRLIVGAAGRSSSAEEPAALHDAALPIYSVLVPLSREADVLPDLLDALRALDYPRAKLDVLLLVEPEDLRLRAAIAAASLPPWIRVVLGPIGGALRTKPRALNIGLMAAAGTLLTVYDAEDRPAPDQLRRAAAHFHADPTLECLQSQLSIRDDGRVLAKLFAIEYAALFAAFNPGLAAFGLPIALGGTSNHFRRVALQDSGGWDAWNVTEDADLGIRLARFGQRVAHLDSTTDETAPHTILVWFRQRRRWTKGWMQTLLVLARDAPKAVRQLGPWQAAAVGLLLVNLVVAPLALPPFATVVVWHLARYGIPDPHGPIELVEATLAGSVFLMGFAAPLWWSYAGLRATNRLGLSIALPLLLPYQLLIGAATWMGFFDLMRRPFHWHKTPHRPVGTVSRSSP